MPGAPVAPSCPINFSTKARNSTPKVPIFLCRGSSVPIFICLRLLGWWWRLLTTAWVGGGIYLTKLLDISMGVDLRRHK